LSGDFTEDNYQVMTTKVVFCCTPFTLSPITILRR
jgi:hypothetical protein